MYATRLHQNPMDAIKYKVDGAGLRTTNTDLGLGMHSTAPTKPEAS